MTLVFKNQLISLENFAIYVTETDYFMSNFPPITADWLEDLKENKQVINVDNYNIRVAKMENSNYFNMLLATYISTFLSGISLINLHTKCDKIHCMFSCLLHNCEVYEKSNINARVYKSRSH